MSTALFNCCSSLTTVAWSPSYQRALISSITPWSFSARAREFYDRERLWRAGKRRDAQEMIVQRAL